MKWYLCYEDYVWVGGSTYMREIREWGKCPYDTKDDAEDALAYWKSVDPVQYDGMFVCQM